jgi:RNA polymerase sigma-70 factor (ECF subfamily)
MAFAVDNTSGNRVWRVVEWRGVSSVGTTRAVDYHGYADAGAAGAANRRGVAAISSVTPQSPLLHRVASGDEAAVQECIARFGGLVWSLARRIGLPDAEAEDVVHEIFTELWKNGHKYDSSIASETAFVATIARRRLIDRRRRLGRQPLRTSLPDDAGEPIKVVRDGASVSEEAGRAATAFVQLSAEQQRVLRLSVYEGLSHELISRATGMPLGTVKTHARRGLIRLRELLGVPAPAVAGSGDAAANAGGGTGGSGATYRGPSADDRHGGALSEGGAR